jgi:large conductance mechanosensitive channel
MWKDFKAFIVRGNVIDLAVGIVIGAAFGAIVSSVVADIIMPPIGLLFGRVDFANLYVILKDGKTPGPYESLTAAKAAGAVSINYGIFIMTIINFVIVAFAVFILVKSVTRMQKQFEKLQPTATSAPATRECPYCFTTIPIKATRCPNCTSQLTGNPKN